MENTILHMSDIAETETGFDEQGFDVSDLEATEKPSETGIQFHVSMQGHTMNDMETLIVEAAASRLVDRFGGNRLAKLIEDRAIDLITKAADARLMQVTSEILDQPMQPKFNGAKSEPITMREFIGMTGRDYLTQWVDRDGRPTQGGYNAYTRIQNIVSAAMDNKFKSEIATSTSSVISEIRNAVKARHEKVVSEEKARIAEALAKIGSDT
jgi:hypothetical protein